MVDQLENEVHYHWVEGMKFALEAGKTSFILNGAATVSVLTFIGNNDKESNLLVYAMGFFALGAVTAPISLVLAYLTQLEYGNASLNPSESATIWTKATRLHHWVYRLFFSGIILFFYGVTFAGLALYRFNI